MFARLRQLGAGFKDSIERNFNNEPQQIMRAEQNIADIYEAVDIFTARRNQAGNHVGPAVDEVKLARAVTELARSPLGGKEYEFLATPFANLALANPEGKLSFIAAENALQRVYTAETTQSAVLAWNRVMDTAIEHGKVDEARKSLSRVTRIVDDYRRDGVARHSLTQTFNGNKSMTISDYVSQSVKSKKAVIDGLAYNHLRQSASGMGRSV